MVYITAQSVWWAMLLLRRDETIAELRTQLGQPASSASSSTIMVVGEAGVFLLLLVIVLGFAFMAMRRDLRLAAMQRNFMLAITHELRTPIASIKLQLQTLARPGLSSADSEHLRCSAIGEADRLAGLTEKVLKAASEGSPQMRLVRSKVDAAAIVSEVYERATQRDGAAHSWTISMPTYLTVQSDPEALRSIVENLLENAAKYAPAGTRVDVIVRTEGAARWVIEVADQGPGIALGERGKVFDLFYRSGSEETRQQAGTGLGLYIVKRLTTRLGGTISIRDASPHGAIFTASFPMST